MSDTSENAYLMYELTMVPSLHQIGIEQQIIRFFDKRRTEMLLIQWILLQNAIDVIELCIPHFEEIIEENN